MIDLNPSTLISNFKAKHSIDPYKFLDLIKHHIDLGDYDVYNGTQIRVEMFNSGLAVRLKDPNATQELEAKLLDMLEDEGYSSVRVFTDCLSNGFRAEIHYVRVLLDAKSMRKRPNLNVVAAASAMRNI